MNKAEKSSDQPSQALVPNKYLLGAFVLFAFIGFLDTSYLTISHFTGAEVNCSIVEGCNEVLASKYSSIFGIPLALLGLLHYTILLVGGFYYLDSRNPKVLKPLMILTTFGLLFSAWLVYLQFFVIKSICQYCMVSAVNSVILFIFALILNSSKK